MADFITLKGSKEGIVVCVDAGDTAFETLCERIAEKLKQSKGFLGHGAELILDTGERALTQGEQLALKVLLQHLGYSILRFAPDTKLMDTAAVLADLQALAQGQQELRKQEEGSRQSKASQNASGAVSQDAAEENPMSDTFTAEGAMLVRRTLRSGQKISYDGTLIIMGDVNAGAELVATGHIFVLGALRGIAHAGCQGNRRAVIYTKQLQSLQVRIADLIASTSDGKATMEGRATMVGIVNGNLIIEEV